jgi:hypothetical protein
MGMTLLRGGEKFALDFWKKSNFKKERKEKKERNTHTHTHTHTYRETLATLSVQT